MERGRSLDGVKDTYTKGERLRVVDRRDESVSYSTKQSAKDLHLGTMKKGEEDNNEII